MPWPVHPTGFFGARGDNDTYRIERSLRFNSADSAYLNRTPASAGNRKTWTWSGWVKVGALSTERIFLSNTDTSGRYGLYFGFRIPNTLEIGDYGFSSFDWVLTTSALFRDTSAWYHIVASIDTTQATASNRVRLYVNGSQINSFSASTYPSQNADLQINSTSPMSIGRVNSNSFFYDGYITEVYFIDGQALTPSSFGETDAITGRWKAKAYSGTYGTNGFYLKFADNSGTTATTLGKDSSGNGNNWTPNNFSVTAGAGNDSLVDSPTNYGTDSGVGGEVRGNYCTLNPLVSGSGTISNGNLDLTTNLATAQSFGSIQLPNTGKWYWEFIPTSNATYSFCGIGSISLGKYVAYYGDGQKYIDGANTNYGASYTNNDVIGVAVNCDSGSITFYKNNSSQGSISYTISGNNLFPYFADGSGSFSVNLSINFGQRPFAYTAPTGFKALCTTNLPTPTIKKPSSYMDVVLRNGTGTTGGTISSLSFSPDFLWTKTRSSVGAHTIHNSLIGSTKYLSSNTTGSEITDANYIVSFNSNGYTIGSSDWPAGTTVVDWAWDEAPIAGMDIVAFTAPSGTSQSTVEHNLGVAPKMIIAKNRDTSANNWAVFHSSVCDTTSKFLQLNTTAALQTFNTVWGASLPTSSVFGVTGGGVAASGVNCIAYLFAEVEGFSKFGSYTGNGSADGPFVWCGFRPRYVLIKRTDSTSEWFIWDTARSTFNEMTTYLSARSSNAESTFSGVVIDCVSNGLKLRGSYAEQNASGGTYIFAAFAESPFKYARAR